MKIYQFLLAISCLIFCSFQSKADAQPTLPNPSQFKNYTNITNNHNSNQYQITVVGLDQLIEHINNLIDACMNFKSKCKELATFDHLTTWCKKHRLAIGGCALLGVYAIITKELTAGRLVIHNNTAWANWKNHATLEDLINIDSHQLSRELHLSILNKYNNNNQMDAITPLTMFSKDLEQELERLRKFVQLSHYLKLSRTNRLFFVSEKEIALIQEKIHRLLYLKKIIIESIQVSFT